MRNRLCNEDYTENTDFPSELESQLRIMENVIRFMTVAVEA